MRYVPNYKVYRFGRWNTSEIEIQDLLKAWVVISIAFAILLEGFTNMLSFSIAVLISSVTVGSAFLLHELAHKMVAQRYGCFAEFRADNFMLIFALLLAVIFRVVFIAPGAVMISGRVSKSQNGKISTAGPFTNVILALIFLTGNIVYPAKIFFYGYMINAWIGLFNMIPFWIFDGRKIFNWNKIVYTALTLFSAALVFTIPLFTTF